jgi:hypothetical protein
MAEPQQPPAYEYSMAEIEEQIEAIELDEIFMRNYEHWMNQEFGDGSTTTESIPDDEMERGRTNSLTTRSLISSRRPSRNSLQSRSPSRTISREGSFVFMDDVKMENAQDEDESDAGDEDDGLHVDEMDGLI